MADTLIEESAAAATPQRLSHIRQLEAESIHILREVAAEFQKPVMLYSIGKDSSVMLRLAQKAFCPGPIPFPLLHIDTGYKFREMLEFRDRCAAELGLRLIVWRNEDALANGANPAVLGTRRCCGLLKTQALLDALRAHGFDAAFGGARRDEEKSRAKERIFSFRDSAGQWDPKNQRPELWNLFNSNIHPGESIRVFPLSNWTELDVWHYIHLEKIPIVPLYFAKERRMLVRGDSLIPVEQAFVRGLPGAPPSSEEQWVRCRLRSLGCSPCTGAIRSDADTVPGIIAELMAMRHSERANRLIDHDQDGSMELKKREGYF
jgi:sulfate adenylyltransferase subunit 2